MLRFNNASDLRGWSLLINRKLPPILNLLNDGDVYEREGFHLTLGQEDKGYFSELGIAAEDYDVEQIK